MVAPVDGPSAAPGTGFEVGKHNTALQAHVAFFDRDDDGIIWPGDTYRGFRELKFGVLLSILAMLVIHSGFSYITWGSILPDPFFRLKVKYMHRAKHGSDSGVYTTLGEFDDNRFEYIFNMYSTEPHTHLTFTEGVRMVHGNRNPYDPFGWFSAVFEWLSTYLLLWPVDGRGMRKEDVKAIYNGSLFYRVSGKKPKY
ncbi:putative peroxygenase 3 [Psilocybe cubensis]|uniref:Caleosin n=2 Tax=Psilocybe cubensis TaxID=181762 RepID=A0A8H7Y8J5_PSICU|nr:putative peroxygenase 3 [Psilocybe cubensis]KAH9487309.1 putative peroxygenase 3 [Psilocybe cubensis]